MYIAVCSSKTMAQGNQVQKRNLAAEAFGRHYDTLHSALAQPDVASGLATKFYNGAIITSEIRDVVQMTSFTPKQQADWLLPVVESSIRTDHRKLRRLIKVLRKQPVLKPIAKQLHQCYRKSTIALELQYLVLFIVAITLHIKGS